MDSASDVDVAANALGIGSDGPATFRASSRYMVMKGRSPYLKQASFDPPPSLHSATGSLNQLSPSASQMLSRTTRPSNAEEYVDDPRACEDPSTLVPRRNEPLATFLAPFVFKGPWKGSVRSIPPHARASFSPQLPEPKLTMTPKNIALLENGKEVDAEIRELVKMHGGGVDTNPTAEYKILHDFVMS